MTEKELLDQIAPCDMKNSFAFVSYSSADAIPVYTDVLELQRRGYNIWLDEKNLDKTKPSWKDDALAAIKNYCCRFLIFYVSRSSLVSAGCCEEMELCMRLAAENPFDPLKFICIDVEDMGNITVTAGQLAQEIRNGPGSNEEKQSKRDIMSQLLKDVFNNTNERIRIHPKYEVNRKKDYYLEVTSDLPDDVQNQPVRPAPSQPSQRSQQPVQPLVPPRQVAGAEKKTITYQDGSVYTGDVLDGKRVGWGKYTFSGGVYEGEWANDVFHGHGKLTASDNSYTYEGDFADALFHGHGRMTWANGYIYDGDWQLGKRAGQGKLIFPNGKSSYTGSFVDGRFHGMGRFTLWDGEYYEGEFQEDKSPVYGRRIYSDGKVYEGQLQDGRPSGKGRMVYKNKHVYEGQWVDGQRSGQGKMLFDFGDFLSYIGQWSADKRSGQGIMTYRNGDVYDGQWAEGVRSGQGKMTYKNGSVYEGEWKQDKRSGQGKMIYDKNLTYEGQWENDEESGFGRLTRKKVVMEGEWRKGTPILRTMRRVDP